MNLPPVFAGEGGGMAIAQLQRIARIADRLVRFSNYFTPDAYTARSDPLFGTALRCIGVLQQQPIQQGLIVPFHYRSLTSNLICGCATGTRWNGWPIPGGADPRVDRRAIGGIRTLPVWVQTF